MANESQWACAVRLMKDGQGRLPGGGDPKPGLEV